MADKNEVLDNFVNITGVDKDRAKFYLDAAAWNLELAMASFYEGDGEEEQGDIGLGVQGHAAPVVEAPKAGGSTGQRQGPKPASRFATIGNMRDDSDSSDEEGQAFYAGGSEHSGQQVLGPKKKNKNIVEDLFKSARDHGAEEVGKDDEDKPRPRQFVGSGYRLGDTEGQASEVVRGAPAQPQRKQVDCVLKLWKNGFSVDDGPLRDFKDPDNREFLNAISKGEVPQELIREAKGGEVNLNMEDHRTEDYVKPKVPMKAFTGEGHTLGSPAPTVVQSTPSQPVQAQGSTSSVKVDESRPHTTIQIRLADGSRIVGKFNYSHTVADIRSHIVSFKKKCISYSWRDKLGIGDGRSRPQYAGVNFVLQTTFPNRELSNNLETVEQAKLLNAVVVQRLK